MKNVIYLFIGILFGVILIQSEVSSWYRIQEMFRFQSFHMYGVMGSAIVVAVAGKLLFFRNGAKALSGAVISTSVKQYRHSLVIGGLIFGLGWGLSGVCPGPSYALMGKGVWVMSVFFISALAGTWVYSALRDRLPL
jgi:hypothetical protein